MDSTADIKQMRDALMSRVDEQLAHTYEQIKSADEQLARMGNQLSGQGREATQRSHPQRSHPQRSRGRPWLRGLVGLLLAAYIVGAAVLSQSPYGGAVERQAPQLASAFAFPKRIMQLAAAEPPARIKPDDTSTAQVSPEPPMSLETMARDLAELERKVELLHAMVSDNEKAVEQIQENHQQVVRDIARNAELLKASQEQVAKLAATTSQQNLRPRTSGPEPQPPSGALKPVPTPASSHANARPQAPTQLRPQER